MRGHADLNCHLCMQYNANYASALGAGSRRFDTPVLNKVLPFEWKWHIQRLSSNANYASALGAESRRFQLPIMQNNAKYASAIGAGSRRFDTTVFNKVLCPEQKLNILKLSSYANLVFFLELH